MFLNLFYEASITLVPKLDKENIQKRKLQVNTTDKHICKNPQLNISNPNPYIKRISAIK